MRLTNTIDAADPLFNFHGIPGQIPIEHDAAELQVKTFAADF